MFICDRNIGILIIAVWGTLVCPPVSASPNRSQSAYQAEFGKKFLHEGKTQAALNAFARALVFDAGNQEARQLIQNLLTQADTRQSADYLRLQYFIETVDYVRFLGERIESNLAENRGIIKLFPASDFNDRNDSWERRFRSETPASLTADRGLAELIHRLNGLKSAYLEILSQTDALNYQLRQQKNDFSRRRQNKQERSQTEKWIARIKDLELAAARKNQIIDQQAINIQLLADEIKIMRNQYALLQDKLSEIRISLNELTGDLAARTLEAFERGRVLADKEQELSAVREQLFESRQRTDLMQRIIQEKELQNIAAVPAGEYDQRLQDLAKQIQDLNTKYEMMQKSLLAKEEQLARLNDALAVKDTKIENLKSAYFLKERRVNELSGMLEIYKSKLDEKIKTIDAVDERIQMQKPELPVITPSDSRAGKHNEDREMTVTEIFAKTGNLSSINTYDTDGILDRISLLLKKINK